MKQEFEALAYDAACMIIGEAVWQLMIIEVTVSLENIARMILGLCERRDDLAVSIALSVLLKA